MELSSYRVTYNERVLDDKSKYLTPKDVQEIDIRLSVVPDTGKHCWLSSKISGSTVHKIIYKSTYTKMRTSIRYFIDSDNYQVEVIRIKPKWLRISKIIFFGATVAGFLATIASIYITLFLSGGING